MSFNTVLAPFISPTRRDEQANDPIYEKMALLDGGFGTTLQHVFNKDVSHPLWSARFVDQEEDVIVAAHLAFLEAGAQVILTSTYQEAYETFRRAGYSDLDAESLMCKSVDLAARAIETHMKAAPVGPQEVKHRPRTALSLGPYGSTLEVAAEFTGVYPPPYGPVADPSGPAAGPFLSAEEPSYIHALAAFHFSRLLVYARNPAVWDKIDIVAFETVPLLTEARAIRVAVARLMDWFAESMPQQQEGADVPPVKMKPWYISFVFTGPNGEFPQRRLLHPGESVLRPCTPYDIAKGVFTAPEGTEGRRMARPDGIGVNCTSIHCIRGIVQGIADAIQDVQADGADTTLLPWLVLCPNGGRGYDTVNKVWMEEDGGRLDVEDWTGSYTTLVRDIPGGRFGGLLLGGCCNTTPNEIRALGDALRVL
ncbi:Homocysteine S-methyltransferase [Hysterangium stoloniferum]|nr:Homocysteine S-methyltransferase [Hysterangium stoloniferum]